MTGNGDGPDNPESVLAERESRDSSQLDHPALRHRHCGGCRARPASAWAAADRKKAFWVTLLAIFGVVMFIPYVIGVLPRLVDAGRAVGTSPFEKGAPSPFEKN